MRSQGQAKNISDLVDELLSYMPDSVTDRTALGPLLVTAVYDTTTRIRALRTPDTREAWETSILSKLDAANLPKDRLRTLTYCVMFAQDDREPGDPLVRGANSTFANVLLRRCATVFEYDLNQLKPLIQLYYNLDAKRNIPSGISDPENATAGIVNFAGIEKVSKLTSPKESRRIVM